jgi:hypothetical protein
MARQSKSVSFSERAKATCSTCQATYPITLWVVVDALCDPELESRAARGKLHTITCPNGHTGEAPIPLLLLKEGEPPAILLVPRGASDSDGVSHFELCARLIKDPERKAQLPRFDDMCLVHAEDVVGIGSPLRQDELLGAVPRLDALVRTAKSSEQAASAPLEEGGLPPLALSVAHWEGVTRHRAFAAAPDGFAAAPTRWRRRRGIGGRRRAPPVIASTKPWVTGRQRSR